MAIVFIGTDSNGFDASIGGDVFVLSEFSTLSNSGDAFDFLSFSSSQLLVLGVIISEGDGIDSDDGSFSNLVTVAEGAFVYGESDGIEMDGTAHTVNVAGEVGGEFDAGVEMIGAFNTVSVTGLVYGGLSGVDFLGNANELNNIGTITSGNIGVKLNGDSNQVFNSGTIFSSTIGVDLAGLTGARNVLNNSGTISAAGSAAVRSLDSSDVIFNTGVLFGAVTLFNGDDIYDGRGGEVTGVVQGGDGDDTLLGGALGEVMEGEVGRDRLSGYGGDDTLSGGGGIDTIYGGDGDDSLDGGGGADTLKGGAGEDTLLGGGGGDRLAGGKNADILTGGGGADTFVIAPSAGSDVITDFEDGIDLIDLTAFGLRPALFNNIVEPLLTNAGGATSLDLAELGGSGILLIEGLAIGNADASDFIL